MFVYIYIQKKSLKNVLGDNGTPWNKKVSLQISWETRKKFPSQ